MSNDAQQGKVLGDYAVKKMAAKKVAIIDDRTAYGQGLADEFEKAAKAAGAEVVKREFTTNQETDFNAILTSIKGAKPDLIFYGGMDAQAAPLKNKPVNWASAPRLWAGTAHKRQNLSNWRVPTQKAWFLPARASLKKACRAELNF